MWSKQTEILVLTLGLVCAQLSKVRCLADLTTGGLITRQRLTTNIKCTFNSLFYVYVP